MELTYTDRATLMSRRQLPLPAFRMVIWLILHDKGYGYVQIGRYFGRKHSTVIHGIRRAGEFISIRDKMTMTINDQLRHD